MTFKEGKVLLPHRTDQTNHYHLLTQSVDQCSEATKAHPTLTPQISKHALFQETEVRLYTFAVIVLPSLIHSPHAKAALSLYG